MGGQGNILALLCMLVSMLKFLARHCLSNVCVSLNLYSNEMIKRVGIFVTLLETSVSILDTIE